MAYQSGELDDLGVLVAVVEAGGFSAAARVLGAHKAQISRRVAALEERLGVRLLERTTRSVRLTELGAAYYEPAARAVALAREARAAIESGRSEPSGLLRISTTQLLAELVLRPVVLEYLRAYPRAAVEIDVTARPVDMVREGFDLAVRVGKPPGADFVARLLGRGRARFVAAPSFVAAHGVPTRPREVERFDAVEVAGGLHEWAFVRGGARVSVRPRLRLVTPSYELTRQAALGGIGLARFPGYFVAGDLAAGRLVAILEEWTPPPAPVVAVYPSRTHVPPKVRQFVDRLVKRTARGGLFDG